MFTPSDLSHLPFFRLPLPPALTVWEYGKVVLTGRRIGLNIIMEDLKAGHSPNQIRDDYDLDPQQLDQVLVFCRDHPDEVEEYVREYEADAERIWQEYKQSPYYRPGPTREELLRRLAERGHTIRVDLGPEFDRPI